MRTYYKVCPFCGDHLDPGERCECHKGADHATGAGAVELGRLVPGERAILRPDTPEAALHRERRPAVLMAGADLASGRDFTAWGRPVK